MDWDEMGNLNRESSIDASYRVSVYLSEKIKMRKVNRRQVMAKADIAFGKVS
jgi:hypothetical protein